MIGTSHWSYSPPWILRSMLFRLSVSFGALHLLSGWLCTAHAQQTFFPSAVPLTVRSPNFSCWLDTHNGSNTMSVWPTFWNNHTLGWAGYIKVDGLTWHWIGQPPGNASTWLATQITPTRTVFTLQAGPIQLNVTFLSPIEPSDWVRQSFPFSYVYIDGKATDAKQHSIQLYADITGEWVTNDFGAGIRWSTAETGSTTYHQVQSDAPTSVFKDVALDSIAYHAISRGQPNLVSIVGSDKALRAQFFAPGEGFTLTSDLVGQTVGNVEESGGKFPVLAHAVDLGTTDTISSIVWAVGLVRDPITTISGVSRRSYYWSQYGSIGDAIDAFMNDFPAARTRALVLDQKILQEASAVSQEYADLVSLAARQAMAGVEITLSQLNNGSLRTSPTKSLWDPQAQLRSATVLLLAGIAILLRRRRRWHAKDNLSMPRPYHRVTSTAADSPAGRPVPLRALRKSELATTNTIAGAETGPHVAGPTQASSREESSMSRGTSDLRSEVQRLREEMDHLRVAHGVPGEAPPRYQ
ncbi:hypothetical protein DFH06DRAFT_1483612 [Mycena polygramma]|nr:hypothetical protein DFH06DRAFT_1483612 [Mycena polygramma]